ncbi:hypothetical protein L596_023744 [Steinernema carpocapsae]|uniref:Uncharacterized protein n=1 Tax=Steinernema carpocapsae TaxID=34508 RepID=A0A4U5MEL9_STECR|nr:hypothetical protein L596_023744 [Steinernema carpocapsae]
MSSTLRQRLTRQLNLLKQKLTAIKDVSSARLINLTSPDASTRLQTLTEIQKDAKEATNVIAKLRTIKSQWLLLIASNRLNRMREGGENNGRLHAEDGHLRRNHRTRRESHRSTR